MTQSSSADLAFIFPGQGSQAVGMLAPWQTEQTVVETFAEASTVLGYDLWSLVQDGPAERLDRTDHTQPAILTASVALWRLWQERSGAQPAVLAGHSLGEYSALVAAQALSLSAAVELVAERGRYMQEAVAEGEGAMAAVIGLDDERVVAICSEAAQGEVVEAVNFNAPGQVVIAGGHRAVERAASAARAAGAKRVLPLPVSVPSHCRLMAPAAERLSARLRETPISQPQCAVIHNVDVETSRTADEIRQRLVAQLASPVRWTETVERMAAQGVHLLAECGPGKVLSGLVRRIDKRLEAKQLADPASFEQTLAERRQA